MSQENVELVRRLFLKCGMPTGLAAAEADYDMSGFDWPRIDRDQWDVGQVAEEFIDAGGSVIVASRTRARHRPSGVILESRDFMVYVVREGQIVRNEYGGHIHGQHRSRADALEAVGLSEQDAPSN
jgi:hypothetical protein